MDVVSAQVETQERHLRLIVAACRELQPDLTAIILYGGFGRGEGSWYQDEGGAWKPYNDYDVKIVSPRAVPARSLRALAKRLAAEIGIKWVDLGHLCPGQMREMRPSILNYDFKHASKVIYGDPSVLDLIPEMEASALPMKEAQILFFTRLYTFIGSLDENGLDADLAGDASRFFRNQMAKAILAVVDVLLLSKGAYDSSYRKRVERVGVLYPDKEELLGLSRWALQEKLRPQAPRMTADEVRALYAMIHEHYLREMYHALSLRFSRSIGGPQDIEFCMKWRPTHLAKRLFWLARFRGLHMERQLSVMLAQCYLAAAWSPDGIREETLTRGVSLLRQAESQLPRTMTWDQARLAAARLRMDV